LAAEQWNCPNPDFSAIAIGTAIGMIVVLGSTVAFSTDLGPGSVACPEGCEEDAGYAAVGAMFIAAGA